MTSGYEAADAGVPGAPSPTERPGGEAGQRSERLGPLPPRMNPVNTGPITPPSGGPVVPGAGMPGPGGSGSGVPGSGLPGAGVSGAGQGLYPPTGPMPVMPPPTGPMPSAPGMGSRLPMGASPTGGFPTVPASYPGPPVPVSAPVAPAQRPSQRLAVLALLLCFVLIVVAAVQTFLLIRLDNELEESNRAAASAAERTDSRLDGVEARAKQLEQRNGNTLDPAAVAEVVTPSVFKVIAGRASGTAFAFGKAPDGGGTDLVTNYHVVKELFQGGSRDVALERDNKRFNAKIARVDPAKDLAIVHCAETFPRLAAAQNAAKPGEPILVVGAPLGLESTITTGVVSALRNTDEGSMVQFDAAINPGNSGGPVINAQKQVVGVATAKILDAENVGLAIPVAVVCEALGIC